MIKVITDSVASIPKDMLEGTGVEVVSLFVNENGVEHVESEMDLHEFYKDIYNMIDDIPTSSQPSQKTLEDIFEKAAKDGDEVLGIFISTGLSGTYDGAVRAARAVKARNINFTYALIDSTSCGFDEAWAVFAAVNAVKANKRLSDCVKAVQKCIQSSRFLFTPESLTFLQKGGRIGSAAALLGNLIQLSPVFTVSDTKPVVTAKVRTRKKALAKIMQILQQDDEKCTLKNIVVHYIGSKTPADEWAKNYIEPYLGKEVRVLPVSPVIGLHVGPAVGIAYECEKPLQGKYSKPLQTLVCTQ